MPTSREDGSEGGNEYGALEHQSYDKSYDNEVMTSIFACDIQLIRCGML